MKLLLLINLFFFGFFHIGNGIDIEKYNKSYLFVCEEISSIGYAWEKSKYIPMEFNKSKYYLEKIKIVSSSKTDTRAGYCNLEVLNSPIFSNPEPIEDKYITYGCYNMRLTDSKFFNILTSKCMETWEIKNYKFVLSEISCGGLGKYNAFNTTIGGYFHLANIHSNTKLYPENNKRNVQTLSVGKCKKVQ